MTTVLKKLELQLQVWQIASTLGSTGFPRYSGRYVLLLLERGLRNYVRIRRSVRIRQNLD